MASAQQYVAAKKAEAENRDLIDTVGEVATRMWENYAKPVGRDIDQFIRSGEWITAPLHGLQRASDDISTAISDLHTATTGSPLPGKTAEGDAASRRARDFILKPGLLPSWLSGPVDFPMQPTKIPEPETGTGGIVSEGARFGSEAAPVAMGATAIGIPTILSWAVGGGFAGFVTDPNEPGMADMLRDVGELDNSAIEAIRSTYVDALARDEDDSTFEKRLKRMVEEGVVLGAGADAALELVKVAYRGTRKLLGGGLTAAGAGLRETSAQMNRVVQNGGQMSDDEVRLLQDQRAKGHELAAADIEISKKRELKAIEAAIQGDGGQISFETMPGGDLGHLPELKEAGPDVQKAYYDAMTAALTDESGMDLLASRLGMENTALIDGPGFWHGETTPSGQVLAGDLMNSPEGRAKAEAYAAMRGIMHHQDAVAWHAPDFDDAIPAGERGGIEISTAGFDDKAMLDLAEKVEAALPDGVSVDSIGFVASASGVRLLNFGELDNEAFHTLVSRLANEAFGEPGVRTFKFDGNLIEGDWSNGAKGYWDVIKGYAAQTGDRDLVRWTRGTYDARVVPAEQAFAQGHGLTRNASLDAAARGPVRRGISGEVDGAAEVVRDLKPGDPVAKFDDQFEAIEEWKRLGGKESGLRIQKMEGNFDGRPIYVLEKVEEKPEPKFAELSETNQVRALVRERLAAKGEAGELPKHRTEAFDPEGRPLSALFIAGLNDGNGFDTPLSTREIKLISEILADVVEPFNKPTEMLHAGSAGLVHSSGGRHGGRLRMQVQDPAITKHNYLDTYFHETGHVVDFRIETSALLRKADPNLAKAAITTFSDGINTVGEAMAKVMQVLDEGMEDAEAAVLGREMATELARVSQTMRPHLWQSDGMLSVVFPGTSPASINAYRFDTRELFADAIRNYMEMPSLFKRDAPNVAALIRAMANEGPWRRIVGFASAGGVGISLSDMIDARQARAEPAGIPAPSPDPEGLFMAGFDPETGKPLQVAGLTGEIIERLARKFKTPKVEEIEKALIDTATGEMARDELLRQKYGIDPAIEQRADGVDFNMGRIEAPEDVKMLIDEVSEQFAPEIDAYKRGVRKLSEIEYDASLLDMSQDDVLKMRTLSAEEFTRARTALLVSATQLRNMAAKVASPDATDRDMIGFRRMIQQHSILQMHVKGLQTEIARSLSAMRITATAEGSMDARMVEQFITETGGRGDIKRMAARLAATEDPAHFARVASKMTKVTRWDMFLEVWYGSLLSNPNTHFVNTVTSAGATAYGLPEMAAAALAGSVRRSLGGEGGVYLRNVLDYAGGMVTGLRVGLKNAGQTLTTGVPADMTSKIEGVAFRRPALTAANIAQLPEARLLQKVLPEMMLDGATYAGKAFDVLTEIWPRGVSRLMMTADQANKGIAYTAMLNARVGSRVREGLLDGSLDADQARTLARDMLDTPETTAADLHMKSVQYGQHVTFQEPLGPRGQAIQRGIRAIIGSQLIVPFLKTPANIIKYTAARTPAAPLIREFREAVMGSDPFERDLALGRMALGSSIGLTMMSLAQAGYITGGGPTDWRLRKQLEETGWQEYSLVIPKNSPVGKMLGLTADQHRSFKRFDPFAQALGIAADLNEVWGYATEEERGLMAAVLSTALYRNVTSKTWMTGLSDMMQAVDGMESGNLSAAERLLANIAASSAVPSGVRWLGSTEALGGDPTRRSAKPRVTDPDTGEDVGPILQWLDGMARNIRRRTGAYSGDLPPQRNFWGEEQVMTPGVLVNTIPFYRRDSKVDTDALEAAGLPTAAASWARLQHPYNMDDAQHLAFVQAVGVDGEVVRLGNPLGYHPDAIEGVKLNPEEIDSYVVAVNSIRPERGSMILDDGRPVLSYEGKTMQEAMTELVQTPEYREASDFPDVQDSKVSLLRRVVSFYRHRAEPDVRSGLGGADRLAAELHPPLMQRIMLRRTETLPLHKLLEAN